MEPTKPPSPITLLTLGADEAVARDYQRVARAISGLEEGFRERPSLEAVARAAELSPYHFQRLFARYAGVSPKRFLQGLHLAHAKAAFLQGEDVLSASLDAGLSGPGRLHELFVTVEALTPGEWRAQARGVAFRAGLAPSPFGVAAALLSPRGLAGLGFAAPEDSSGEAALGALVSRFPEARWTRDDAAVRALTARLFEGAPGPEGLSLQVRGTGFQLQVWRALLELAPGETTTYGALASGLGMPSAGRAVGQAVGHNPIAWLIPCHRVLRGSGALGGYAWGTPRKRAMLALEALQPPLAGARRASPSVLTRSS
ncbi:MAG: methylated-DNA--[protein]-cysteine S-methyltransferase [Deltaproteobacteria bacterium]|nr:methylated-DNA--[protein]-cysteine S-methyltransferase [Deltaproteobacteria bacterium]